MTNGRSPVCPDSTAALRAVSHSVGAHTESLQPRVDSSSSSKDEDEASQTPAVTTSAKSESEKHYSRLTLAVYKPIISPFSRRKLPMSRYSHIETSLVMSGFQSLQNNLR